MRRVTENPARVSISRRRRLALRLLPPILLDALTTLLERFSRKPPEWEHVADGRFPQDPTMSGWNVESVLAEQLRKWDRLIELTTGSGPLGIDPHAAELTNRDYRAHNNLMTFGYVLALCGRKGDAISILDWGSGPGQYLMFARALLPEVQIDYHGVDVPIISEGGRRAIPEATFYDHGETAFERRYDLVVASGSLQYVERWRDTVSKLVAAAGSYLYIVVPVVRHSEPFVILQRPHRYGYETEFTQWVFNRDELTRHIESLGMKLRREFLNEEMGPIKGTPERGATMGFLFQR